MLENPENFLHFQTLLFGDTGKRGGEFPVAVGLLVSPRGSASNDIFGNSLYLPNDGPRCTIKREFEVSGVNVVVNFFKYAILCVVIMKGLINIFRTKNSIPINPGVPLV